MVIAYYGNCIFLCPVVFLVCKIHSSKNDAISQIILTWLTNKLSTGVLDRAKCSQSCCETFSGKPLPDSGSIGRIYLFDCVLFERVIFSVLFNDCILRITSGCRFRSYQAWMEGICATACSSCKPCLCTYILQCHSHSRQFNDSIFDTTR